MHKQMQRKKAMRNNEQILKKKAKEKHSNEQMQIKAHANQGTCSNARADAEEEGDAKQRAGAEEADAQQTRRINPTRR